MRGVPSHWVRCSYCDVRILCRCFTGRRWDHILWCAECEERYVVWQRRDA